MSLQSWQETLAVMTVPGTAFNTYTTAKTVIPVNSLYTIPAGYFTIGKMLRVTALGSISNIVTTPGLIAFQLMLGTNVVFTTGNVQLNATAHTTLPFRFQAVLTCRAVGAGTSANFMGMGEVAGVMFTVTAAQVDGVNSQTIIQEPPTLPAVGAGFDSTIANVLDFWVGFTVSNVANQIQLQQYIVESLN